MQKSLPSYQTTHLYWKQYQSFFPEEVRLSENTSPEEEWWESNGIHLHIDRLPVPESPIKILFIHGAGEMGGYSLPMHECYRTMVTR